MKLLILLCSLLFSMTGFSQEADSIHQYVDVPAEFPGGNKAMMHWVSQNLVVSSGEAEVLSQLSATFVVEKDGTLTHIRMSKTPSPEAARQLAGMIKSMPKWTPAKHNGQVVRSHYHLAMHVCM